MTKLSTIRRITAATAISASLVFTSMSLADDSKTITTTATDGITVYGEQYFAELDNKTPLILLFHQAGSNGRGEYAELIPWLNENGFRVIAWDQRAGGSRFGNDNRTVADLPEGTAISYCDARPDLQAGLDYAINGKLAEQVIVWGSSYSAALVFGLAADNQDEVAGVLSFSPATGGAMADCRASRWINDVDGMMIHVGRPASEMARESSITQKVMFNDRSIKVRVIENGVHGSSMLVDSRTEHDMTDARKQVLQVLNYMAW